MGALVAESHVAEAMDLGLRAVRIRSEKDAWPLMKTPKQGGSQRFFIRDLLPAEVKARLIQYETITGPKDPVIIHEAPVPKRARRAGLAKYTLVHAFRCAKEQAPWGEKGRAADDFLLAYNSGLLLPAVFDALGEVRLKTLEAMDNRLRENEDDYLSLCDGRGGWKKHGTTRYKGRSLSEAAKLAFLRCYLNPARPTVITAIRAARIILRRDGTPEPAGDSTFRRWFQDYSRRNAGVICLAREGMKAYQDQYGPYISRDASLLEVGQCLVADGKTLNFFIRHPETGRPCRMTLILFFDWASRYPVGWQIMPTEDQLAILAAFRNAVETLGRYPDSVYLDNGRAFKAKLFTETDPDLESMVGLYARVGTAVMFAKPYNGRAKVVERFFETFQDQFEWLMPSYCGDSVETRPAWLSRNETFHRTWHAARTQGWVPSIQDAAHFISVYIQWYGRQPHRGLEACPADLFLPKRGPGVDMGRLNHDFLWQVRVVPRNCRVTIWGIDYEADCLHNLEKGRPILAKIDTADMGRAWCYTPGGTYLGEVYPVQACHPLARLFGGEVSMAQVKAANQRLARLRKNAKAQLTRLGIARGAEDGLNILPFAPRMEKAPILPVTGREAPAPEPDLPEKEVRRLESLTRLLAGRQEELPEIPRPKYWETELQRYEWCFRLAHEHGRDLPPEDSSFMKAFESLPEFANYRQRFEDLKLVFTLSAKEAQ